ncbi:MAG: hypothetical protein ABJQ37_19935 [Reichenbachiella sp.]|uniref:hypothetical protein n=1 Tax=Reichenbachiella sp. TaxID=2184521 RepID=UPI00329754A5
MKPNLQNIHGEWIFTFPTEIEDQNESFYNAIDLIDYNEVKCQRVLKSIINKFPECHIDAYVHISISFRNQNKKHQSLIYAISAYLIGKNCFPDKFKFGKDLLKWTHLSNRPFLRSCQNLGLEYMHHENYERAIEVLKENIEFYKGDNQGNRYLLLECFFKTHRYKDLGRHIELYQDWSADFLYGKILFDILINDGKNIQELIGDALDYNPHILSQILKETHIKPNPIRIKGEPHFDVGSPVGSIQEAYDYWEKYRTFYNQEEIKSHFYKVNKTLLKKSRK